MTPFDDFIYLINHVLLGEEPTIEDFILLVGTLVAFIAFILWCCFPIQPKEPGQHRQFTCRIITSHIKAFDKATNTDNAGASSSTTVSSTATASNIGKNIGNLGNIRNLGNLTGHISNNNNNNNHNNNLGNIGSAFIFRGVSNLSGNSQYNSGGTYSKSGTVAMHNYYVKSGHHCCT
ncbi:putative uncharacterized protein DDB_G0283223 [Drosophila grimshawi]|uniref:putative uncharacterized protein DDB_G0283223 n=1 Tax=Drosophila grimshawi TaxID=7222 RepID=UPI000C86E915|nr:putative uncharacterized protein DDB_G0283223 [Drosophila grimshawi]